MQNFCKRQAGHARGKDPPGLVGLQRPQVWAAGAEGLRKKGGRSSRLDGWHRPHPSPPTMRIKPGSSGCRVMATMAPRGEAWAAKVA